MSINHKLNLWNYQTFIPALVPQGCKVKIIEFLEGRKEEDVFPVCYRINTTKKIKKTAAITGFEVKEVNVVNSSPTTVSLGAFVIVELLVIKLLSLAILKEMRSNIIAILRKKNY